jgi:hypothetical protein
MRSLHGPRRECSLSAGAEIVKSAAMRNDNFALADDREYG